MATPQLVSIGSSNPVNHYKAYKPRPFRREERDKVTANGDPQPAILVH